MTVLVDEILNTNIRFTFPERRIKGILLPGEGLLLLLIFFMVWLLIIEMLSIFVMRKVVDRLILFHYFLIGAIFIFKNADRLNYFDLSLYLLNLQIILVDFLFTDEQVFLIPRHLLEHGLLEDVLWISDIYLHFLFLLLLFDRLFIRVWISKDHFESALKLVLFI